MFACTLVDVDACVVLEGGVGREVEQFGGGGGNGGGRLGLRHDFCLRLPLPD